MSMNSCSGSLQHCKPDPMLFVDAGLITIADDMTVCVSRKYGSKSDTFYNSVLRGYDGQLIEIPEKFIPIAEFLAYHREAVFERG